MVAMWTTQSIIQSHDLTGPIALSAPPYDPPDAHRGNIMLGVEEMSRHMTDEGWQLTQALAHAEYEIAGHNCGVNLLNVPEILAQTDPGTVVVQDVREWDPAYIKSPDRSKRAYRTIPPGAYREYSGKFDGIEALQKRKDVFKVMILKDAHHKPWFYADANKRIGTHAWIVYYNPHIVNYVAPYTRLRHLIRTYHTLDPAVVPEFNEDRAGCLLSGSLTQKFYPLRYRLSQELDRLPETTLLEHPGYHAKGSCTNQYLQTLSKYKVAICTSSKFGYALRKIMEATAAGCRVITDLPCDDPLPGIDGNLIRVSPDIATDRLAKLLRQTLDEYDQKTQRSFAEAAVTWYDYRVVGQKLAADIEQMRQNYW